MELSKLLLLFQISNFLIITVYDRRIFSLVATWMLQSKYIWGKFPFHADFASTCREANNVEKCTSLLTKGKNEWLLVINDKALFYYRESNTQGDGEQTRTNNFFWSFYMLILRDHFTIKLCVCVCTQRVVLKKFLNVAVSCFVWSKNIFLIWQFLFLSNPEDFHALAVKYCTGVNWLISFRSWVYFLCTSCWKWHKH